MGDDISLEDFDRLCNEGFKKLDELRHADMVKSEEYGQTLRKLQELTRKRMAKAGLIITPLK